jgi:mono/diheme cytochrome c family protein
VILVPAALMWAIFLARTRAPRTPGGMLRIPQALRPGDPDEVLEGSRLERIQAAGLIATLATAVFIPAYWLPETNRQADFQERFDEESLHRGRLIFQAPPELEEDASPQEFREQEEALALGMGCANCHGGVVPDNPDTPEDESAASAGGGFAMNGFVDPVSGKRVQYVAPPLNTVFQRWDEEVIRFTIERGRPGTPMPTWGVEYGGPMTPQMIDDVIEWLKSLPGNQEGPPELSQSCQDPSKSDYVSCGQEIFETRCAVCHGPQGQGKEGSGEETSDPWYPGAALWKGDVRHRPRADRRQWAALPVHARVERGAAAGHPDPAQPSH